MPIPPTLQLGVVYEKTWNLAGKEFRIVVCTFNTAGDWAALVLNGVNLVEVGGDAVDRLTYVAQQIVSTFGGTP